ncbi:putative glutamyl-trna synthetase [Diaporthe ampelina]|uniref:Putative glutamyl-trna synthetase n=1 Tax=Diaporthe ampelina TaxID=1214573 RepID=A0A0G2HH14_9PEZI|nr:putative glutamyl-trna synthetase [Diaporthe ampelina]
MASATVRWGDMPHLLLWFNYLEIAPSEIQTELSALQKQAENERAAASRAGENYNIGLKGTEIAAVTRGYPHIGHAKATFLHGYLAYTALDGKLKVRFDDTNPAKERKEFEEAILHDLGVLVT